MSNASALAIRTVPYSKLRPRWWENNTVIPLIEYEGEAEYPHEFFANLHFRNELIELAANDTEAADDLWFKCSEDILFFVNTFVYTFDPRIIGSTKELPFITYPIQDMAILKLRDSVLNGEDIVVEKSRDMGVTWICLVVHLWFWLFDEMFTSLVVSKNQDLVDSTGDPDCLMWKLDFMYERLPSWLAPEINRIKLHFENKDLKSTIDGVATTGDVGRGGRRTCMLLDEYANMPDGAAVSKATADVTNCRMFVFTPKGTGNDAYAKRESGLPLLTLHWSLHPEKAKGIYIGRDGKLHSPWYDRECGRRSIIDIAQELDIGYRASDSQFFDQKTINKLKDEARDPVACGELDFDIVRLDKPNFQPRRSGRLKLFIHLDMNGLPPRDRTYSLGVDISTGSGSSDSAISVLDNKTQEKVAIWKDNKTGQVELARIAVALGRWFCGPQGDSALMVPEANGPGALFVKKVVEFEYENMYFDKSEKELNAKQSKRPGWYSTQDKKLLAMGDYRNALESGLFVNPDEESLEQTEFYVYSNGTVCHAQSLTTKDPTNNVQNHGDIVIADMLAWKGFSERNESPTTPALQKESEPTALPGSFAYRRNKHRSQQQKSASWL